MKSIKIFAVAGAIGLLGMAGLSSCKQNQNSPEGPDGNYKGEVVKTEFSIAFPEVTGSNGGVLRMPGSTVQAGENKASFRGMESIKLIPFATATIEEATNRGGECINLPNTTPNSLVTADITDKGAKCFTNVSIPIGTKGFLFYAKAIDNSTGTPLTEPSTPEQKHEYGMLVPKVGCDFTSATPAGIGFDLVRINTETSPEGGVKIVNYLNQIVTADYKEAEVHHYWKDCADKTALNSIFTEFTKLSVGSSAGVQFILTELVKSLKALQATNPATEVNEIAQAILDSIDLHATIGGSTPNFTVTLDAGYTGYPASIGLPDGAAGLSFDNVTTKKFALASTTNADGMTMNTTAEHHGLTNFVYPPSLYYFANSALLVSNASQIAQYVDGKEWTTITNAYTDGSEVTLTTRSVAIKDQIQYAVGRLDLKITRSEIGMKDNNPRGSTTLTVSDPIPVTAVLIANQKNVDFQFVPNGEIAYTIYDNAVPASNFHAKYNDWSSTNYTLALETATDAKVTIAIECENNFGDFYGMHGKLIPQGSKFYLLGSLDPEAVKASDLTEYNKTGGKVFKQDYKTEVSLRLNNESLKHAYCEIPDLRTTALELGLSVNLHWESGIAFDVTL